MAEATVRTQTILDQLVEGKRGELAPRMRLEPPAVLRDRALASPRPLSLRDALVGEHVRLIAEIKKASPVAGVLEEQFDPEKRAEEYVRGGAAAMSILTDERRFLGNLAHLAAVRASHEALGNRR